LIRQTCHSFEIEILKGVVSKDHVHPLVSAPPNQAPSEIMKRVRERSSSTLFESLPDLKSDIGGVIFALEDIFVSHQEM
jgi:putative transposase